MTGLYHSAADILLRENAFIIVEHHVNDGCCPWPRVGEFWQGYETEAQRRDASAIYINLLKTRDYQVGSRG